MYFSVIFLPQTPTDFYLLLSNYEKFKKITYSISSRQAVKWFPVMFCVALFFTHTENRNIENAIYRKKTYQPCLYTVSFSLLHKLIPAYDLHIK